MQTEMIESQIKLEEIQFVYTNNDEGFKKIYKLEFIYAFYSTQS